MHRTWLRLLALTLVSTLGAGAARADQIFLKDGFVLVGKVKHENSKEVDPNSNEVITIPKGFFFVDDGARRHYFNPAQVQQVDESFIPKEDTLLTTRTIIFPKYTALPPVLEILDISPFNDKMDRTIKYRSDKRNVAITQHASLINSFYCRFDCSTNFTWNAFYLTRELGADTLREVLSKHKAFEEPQGLPAADCVARRFRYARFFMRAGYYEECDKELDRILKDFPKEKEAVEKDREELRKLQVERLGEEIACGEKAGRIKWVVKKIDDVPEKLATPKVLAQLAAIKNRLTAHEDKIKEVRTHLDALFPKLETPEEKKLFDDALTALKDELNADTIGRFETFLVQARQYERQAKGSGKPDVTPSQLLSLAVTGWLLGNAAGELKLETAQRFWGGRVFLKEYVKAKAADRAGVLSVYERNKDGLEVDEMAQLLNLMPPPDADEKPPVEITTVKLDAGSYELQLPAEYRHTKKYPVLIALHDGKEKPTDMIKRFGEEATKHGYILVAPDWEPKEDLYRFTTREHACVLDTIMDLRRRYQVDSDRIFLFGLGEGGAMAYDVGLSHPDMFAGVLPMSTCPNWFSKHYWPNAQYLPFYVVGGDQSGPNNIRTREQFDKWIPHGYPTHFVQYKGRSNEWFGAEVPSMFDWMNRKKRFYPLTNMGRYGATTDLGDMFATFRTTDNRFYWVSTDKIDSGRLNGNPDWKVKSPATVYARIDVANNTITVDTYGFQQVTVWLARTGQIDFDKPVTVCQGIRKVIAGAKVKPKLGTLLEDFAQRLDRERLFVARIDLKS